MLRSGGLNWAPVLAEERLIAHNHLGGVDSSMGPSFADSQALNRQWMKSLESDPNARRPSSLIVYGLDANDVTEFYPTLLR